MTKPTDENRALGVLTGKWITQGTIRATDDAKSSQMCAIDRYEWLPGEFFVLHKADALIGSKASRSIEVIGFYTEQGC